MMDGRKRKKLGLSLKTTKKTIADRTKLSFGQNHGQYFKQELSLGRDTHNPLQDFSKVQQHNHVIVIEDDPLEILESRPSSSRMNHSSASNTMKEPRLQEVKEQTKTSSCFEAGVNQDFYEGFKARRGFYSKRLVSKNTDWKLLNDLPCQKLPGYQSKSNLSESNIASSQNHSEVLQGTQTSEDNPPVQEKGETLYRNVNFIYSFYSDLPKPCMVCTTRKPLYVKPLENPITMSEEHDSRHSTENNDRNDFYKQSKLFNIASNKNKSNKPKCFDEAESETENQKADWDETEENFRAENGVEFPKGIHSGKSHTANLANEKYRDKVELNLDKSKEKFNVSSACKLNVNRSNCTGIPSESDSDYSCYTKSSNFTDKSYLSSKGCCIEQHSTLIQNTEPAENNSVSKTTSRFAGFRTSRSTELLTENSNFEEAHKSSNRNVNDRSMEMVSSASVKPKSMATFGTITDTSLTNGLNDGVAFQQSFPVHTKSPSYTSSDLGSCPMCLQEFPTWSNDQVEDHISKCPGLEDIICDDNDEW